MQVIRNTYQYHKQQNTLFRLLNIDETTWKFVFRGEFTFAKIGSDSVVIKNNVNNKASITAIATITADATHYKLPIFALLKGQSQNALRTLNDIEGIGKAVSINGWSTQSSMILFLK